MDLYEKLQLLNKRIAAICDDLDIFIICDRMWVVDRVTEDSGTITIKPKGDRHAQSRF